MIFGDAYVTGYVSKNVAFKLWKDFCAVVSGLVQHETSRKLAFSSASCSFPPCCRVLFRVRFLVLV